VGLYEGQGITEKLSQSPGTVNCYSVRHRMHLYKKYDTDSKHFCCSFVGSSWASRLSRLTCFC